MAIVVEMVQADRPALRTGAVGVGDRIKVELARPSCSYETDDSEAHSL